jgi:hypothetical protein
MLQRRGGGSSLERVANYKAGTRATYRVHSVEQIEYVKSVPVASI